LNSALEHNIKKAVYLSSTAIFAPLNGNNVITESTQNETVPPDTYGQTKYLAHQEAIEMQEQGLELLIFMPGLIFGPGFPRTVFMIEALKQRRMRYLPDNIGNINIPLVFSKDLFQAIFSGIERGRFGEQYILVESNPSLRNIVMLISDVMGNNITPKTISYRKALFFTWMAEKSAKLTGRTPRITCEQVRQLFTRKPNPRDSYQFDASKAKIELNWQPTSLKDAMKVTIDSYSLNYENKPLEGI
jgi:nucleoside-diphosphate-sugar epimerase